MTDDQIDQWRRESLLKSQMRRAHKREREPRGEVLRLAFVTAFCIMWILMLDWGWAVSR